MSDNLGDACSAFKKDQNLIGKIDITEREQESPGKMGGLFDPSIRALSGSLLLHYQSLKEIAKQIQLVSRYSRVLSVHPAPGRQTDFKKAAASG